MAYSQQTYHPILEPETHELQDRLLTTHPQPITSGLQNEYIVNVAHAASPAHRDGLGRLTHPSPPYSPDGYFLDPKDGRLKALRIQSSRRLKNPTPWAIQVVYWIFKSVVPYGDGDDAVLGGKGGWGAVAAKILPGSVALVFLMLVPTSFIGEIRLNGHYDRVRYREWLYAKSARNRYEDDDEHEGEETGQAAPSYESVIRSPPSNNKAGISTSVSIPGRVDSRMLSADLGPKYLCFVKQNSEPGELPYERLSVNEYMRRTKSNIEPDFIFLSYTRKQFSVATPEEIRGWNLTPGDFAARCRMSQTDRATLGAWGCHIASSRGLHAFWLDFECLVPDLAAGETSANMADVYRICDIVRVAQSMVIVRGPPVDNKTQHTDTLAKAAWLEQWGTRLWTVPEALLCPGPTIDIYTLGEDQPESMLKRRLAASAWEDASEMRYLLDHYEGSLRLTPLELVSIALEGLMRRQTDMRSGTSASRITGDVSYSLMGLLRRRPLVVRDDGDFEAFARLSLSNDSDKLLERLLCFQPLKHNSPWHEMKDAWDAKLWDVEPHCQVAGIVDNRTITLDGAFGATIEWKKLHQVAFMKRATAWRIFSIIIVRALPGYLLLSIPLLIAGGQLQSLTSSYSSYFGDYSSGASGVTNGLTIAGAIILSLALVLMLATPRILLALYRGKFWSTQAAFYGMHGVPDLGHVEQCLLGINCGRLKWSANGSRLSRHRRDKVLGECVALPPQIHGMDTPTLQVYTVVDTFAMTATAFYAERPPSVVMICGREGGMQRAVLCSYDWTRQTFVRETVLRMKTIVLQRMDRVERFRFSLGG